MGALHDEEAETQLAREDVWPAHGAPVDLEASENTTGTDASRRIRNGYGDHGGDQRSFLREKHMSPVKPYTGKPRGTAAMDLETRREVARKGGLKVSQDKQHMSRIGKKGGIVGAAKRWKVKEKTPCPPDES